MIVHRPAFAHLPKWAQDQIRSLEKDVAERDRIIVATATNSGSDTFWRGPSGYSPLPEGAQVRFIVGGDYSIDARYDKQRGLYISGYTRVVIHPQAANCFYVTMITE